MRLARVSTLLLPMPLPLPIPTPHRVVFNVANVNENFAILAEIIAIFGHLSRNIAIFSEIFGFAQSLPVSRNARAFTRIRGFYRSVDAKTAVFSEIYRALESVPLSSRIVFAEWQTLHRVA